MSANENNISQTAKNSISQHRRRITAMMLVLAFAVAAILYLVIASRPDAREISLGEQIYTNMPSTDSDINVGQIIDATNNKNITPREGYRYRVIITGLSRDGSSGITRIGGMITFVPGTKKGDIAVIQISSVGRTVVNAKLISKIRGKVAETPSAKISEDNTIDLTKNPDGKIIDLTKNPDAEIIKGGIYRGVVSDVGKKGDGIIKIDGKVTFIPGVKKGEKCLFEIAEKKSRFNRGILIEIEK
ncbi:TRAM domain-containing protein [bacterium]|nr:TRAM domain-containing protein [bacterium]